MSARLLRQCLNCGRYMTLEKWYPEMPCEACKQEIDPVSTDKKEWSIQMSVIRALAHLDPKRCKHCLKKPTTKCWRLRGDG